MKKLLEIEQCEDCTHLYSDDDYGVLVCELADKVINAENLIPSWCPLNDAE